MTLEEPAVGNSTVQNTGRFVSHLPAVMTLLLIGGLLYSAGLGAPWYFDDYPNIVSNEKIRDLWQTAGNFFSPRGLAYLSFFARLSFLAVVSGRVPVGEYRPAFD